MKRVPSVRIAFIALLGVAIFTALIMLRPSRRPNDDHMFVGTIQETLGGDTGCWFRFRHATDDDPVVFLADAEKGEILKGLANVNNQDIHYELSVFSKGNSAYYSKSTQSYVVIDFGQPHMDPKNKECPDFPSATLTFSKNHNRVVVPVKGICGCDNLGFDEE